jgi:adenosylmethionine-8-amino-7-oxononanoate aminotransferase
MINKDRNLSYPLVHPLRNFTVGLDLKQMVKGAGIYLEDNDGKSYIDATSGLWNIPLGYANNEINSQIIEQLEQLPFVNLFENCNPTTLKLAYKLLNLTGGLFEKVLFTCTGSESIEAAIKIARQYHRIKGNQGKYKLVSFDISYHGTYYGSMSASGLDQQLTTFYEPKVPGFIFLQTPKTGISENNESKDDNLKSDLKRLEELFAKEAATIAGFIVEPILGSGGIIPIPKEYLKKVKELCIQHDVLLIYDEIATGFGRTGSMFAYEQSEIIPDILCLSKSINNGYLPLGAVLINHIVAEVYQLNHCYIEHFSTQNGNPTACAAGIATIEILQREHLSETVALFGQKLINYLNGALAGHKNIGEIRGRGLMIGIELVKDSQSKTCDLLSPEYIMNLYAKFKEKGLLVYAFLSPPYSAGISLFPPYIINDQDIDNILRVLVNVFNRFVV